MFTTLRRIIRSGFVSFWRNGVVSAASVLVMTVTLFTLGTTIFLGALLHSSLEYLKEKVDVNIYFVTTAVEDEIMGVKTALDTLPEVAETVYTSREQALEEFKTRHENDYTTLQALEELEENPLGASISVRAKETSQYESIARYLEDHGMAGGSEGSIVESVNFYQNKTAIEKLNGIIDGMDKISFVVTVFLVVISVLITFNTVRLAIYTAREEIAIMRLVGADNIFIRGPFIVEGILYGIFAALVTLLALYPVTKWLGDETERFFGTMNIFDYYMQNFWQILFIIAGAGIVLGILSSFLAVRRYLRV
ncbi:MAG: ABC transporter permease [Candidatus Yonathbacteria bacterium]|nr:ABC transporter permease [Candidatus Yonathbacteria bacterium]NTW47440.1 ABC transporter permease [Candidatus Yonathbacteria bacterium]